ncbi:hypothetical protein QBC46DRAFT_317176 [Diplogelasinospora grovesii]|uniref:Secreted protein n=1 Tax=Diplogelasinospora grovesii TaxID=303347 RepID=A0AAN6N4N1_9PEZI|nr:hypothetical protein QBC46DRAFT_317176 [Diplogelasinospora grovesii]
MLSTAFVAVASLLLGANALPAENDASVERRAVTAEGVHMVNCIGNSDTSELVYCSNDGSCTGPVPSSSNICVMGVNFLFTWEGSPQGCTFPSGTKFNWSINADAQDQPNYSLVGTGSNPYHNFNCYKDDQHTLFTSNGQTCKSIYYCLDSN